MNGFGFLEYEDPMDARDVVPGNDTIMRDLNPANHFLDSLSYANQFPLLPL